MNSPTPTEIVAAKIAGMKVNLKDNETQIVVRQSALARHVASEEAIIAQLKSNAQACSGALQILDQVAAELTSVPPLLTADVVA